MLDKISDLISALVGTLLVLFIGGVAFAVLFKDPTAFWCEHDTTIHTYAGGKLSVVHPASKEEVSGKCVITIVTPAQRGEPDGH